MVGSRSAEKPYHDRATRSGSSSKDSRPYDVRILCLQAKAVLKTIRCLLKVLDQLKDQFKLVAQA